MRPRFLPSARTTNWLLTIGFVALLGAFYLRYLVIENSTVGPARDAGRDSAVCFARFVATRLFRAQVFGFAALGAALLNLIRLGLAVARDRDRRHRVRAGALQHRARGACGGTDGHEFCTSRPRARVRARASKLAASHSACQLARPSFSTMKAAPSTSTQAATVSADPRAPSPFGPTHR